MEIAKGIALAVASTFVDMAPYLLLGLTFAGILHVMFSKDFVVRHLGRGGFSDSLKAALLGVPLPLCSCGVVPTAMSLRRNKASDGATVSFLISTPQTGIDSIIATYGMLGPVFAVFRPLAAFVMGVTGGVITTALGGSGKQGDRGDAANGSPACTVCATDGAHAHSIGARIVAMIRYAYGEFLDDISVQLVAGIAISGLISFFMPPDFFTRYVGNEWLAMLLMIVGGIPLYVCATASIPIAAALMMKGLSPGAAFVFLAVGPATNAATVTVIASVMGRRIVTIYLAVIAGLAVVAGQALNLVYRAGEFTVAEHIHNPGEQRPWWFGALSVVFLAMLGFSLGRKYLPERLSRYLRLSRAAEAREEEAPVVIKVEGMTCNKCVAHVTESLQSVPGVASVRVDLKGKKAALTGDFSVDAARTAVVEAGYKAS